MKIKAFSAGLVAIMTVSTFASTVWASDEIESEKFKKELAKYERTGEMKSCLPTHRIRSTRVLDDYHILFKGKNRRNYLMTLSRRCHSLGFNEAITYRVRGGRICSSDIFTVLQRRNTISGPTCGFEKFELLKKIPKEKNDTKAAE